MSNRLELSQRVYRSFPAPLIGLLVNTKGVGRPTAIVESVEGSTGLPRFEEDEFNELMVDMSAIAKDATTKLKALQAARASNGNSSGA